MDGVCQKASYLSNLQNLFQQDWRKGLFHLAADKMDLGQHFSVQFWQDIAKEYITQLCHIPENTVCFSVEEPAPDLLSSWVLKAPPMIGGEYLTLPMLRAVWKQLNLWVTQAAESIGGIHALLQQKAPKWQQVGRVCFHLAENKKDPGRPFAFLATYSTGFASQGCLKHLPLKKALDEYSGTQNHQGLIKLLTPVQKAADQCEWVKNLVDTAEIYQPLAWTANQAYKLLSTVADLEESGLSVRVPNWWKTRARPQVSVTVGSKEQAALGVNAMLDFNVEVALGGTPLSQEEMQQLASASGSMAYLRGQWVELDNEKLEQTLAHWKQIEQQAKNGTISFIDGMRLLAGAPSELQKEGVLEEQRAWMTVSAGQALKNLLQNLKNPSSGSTADVLMEKGLQATLRPYQKEGVTWLSLLTKLGLGACLADDMGLGKTLQVLALLLTQPQSKPSLLVVPASLLGNWKHEAKRFTPKLRLLFAHPSEAKKQDLAKFDSTLEHLKNVDLVVTTYAMLVRQNWLAKVDWNLIILDEAQAIKNPTTRQSRAIKKLKAFSRIALTGTPIENRLSDLWSLFDFINPGLLGSFSRFKQSCRSFEKESHHFEPLKKLISPYILRRMKTDPKIIDDLPEKVETPAFCQLTKEQVYHYQSTVNDLQKSLATVDPKNRRGIVLQALMRLKQICNHPSQFLDSDEYASNHSGKFIRLKQICEELADRQEKVLVFTQFSEIINPLASHLKDVFGASGLTLHGKTPIKQRMESVKIFQNNNGPPFFVLSLKAGGTGLTLTAASHVIHFDRWWNPAVENQATDRAFRIGQKKNVQVHKFITQGTIEEEIDKMIYKKQKLAKEVLGSSDEIKITELSDDELLNLVTLDIEKASMA